MIKPLFRTALVLAFSSQLALACPKATPPTSAEFCNSFKSVAQCHCTASGLTPGMCSDMNVLYSRMITVFRSLQQACNYQRDTSPQDCIDSWNCYRLGGMTSTNGLCNSTGASCA